MLMLFNEIGARVCRVGRKAKMGFLIRMAFWFSLVLLALPLGGDGSPGVNPIQAFFAARAAVDDLSGICERKPDVCEVGKAAMQTIGVRARESARIAYEMLEQTGGSEASGNDIETVIANDTAGLSEKTDGAVTGSVEPAPRASP